MVCLICESDPTETNISLLPGKYQGICQSIKKIGQITDLGSILFGQIPGHVEETMLDQADLQDRQARVGQVTWTFNAGSRLTGTPSTQTS